MASQRCMGAFHCVGAIGFALGNVAAAGIPVFPVLRSEAGMRRSLMAQLRYPQLQLVDHICGTFRREMSMVPCQRNPRCDSKWTLLRRADRVDHGHVGEPLSRR